MHLGDARKGGVTGEGAGRKKLCDFEISNLD